MTTRLIATFMLPLALLVAPVGQTALAGEDMAGCIATRISHLADAAGFLVEQADVIARSPEGSNEVVAKRLAVLRQRALDLQVQMSAALAGMASPEKIERALLTGARRLTLLRSTVTRLNVALLLVPPEAESKQAGRAMAERLDALTHEIPVQDPLRGCR